jgi:osmotically-inducible protein OsmY
VENGRKKASDIALKVGIAGAIAFGALASGFLMSRRGRRLLRDVWLERRPSALEDRVMDVIWKEPVLRRRPVDVAELEPGVIALVGRVRTNDEQEKLVQLVGRVKGVTDVENRLEVGHRAR